MENQLADGIVEHGYGNCNGCTFHVPDEGGIMTLDGTPTISPGPNVTPMSRFSAVLNTDQIQSFSLTPGMVLDAPMSSISETDVLPHTHQVWITWTIQYLGIPQKFVSITYLNPN